MKSILFWWTSAFHLYLSFLFIWYLLVIWWKNWKTKNLGHFLEKIRKIFGYHSEHRLWRWSTHLLRPLASAACGLLKAGQKAEYRSPLFQSVHQGTLFFSSYSFIFPFLLFVSLRSLIIGLLMGTITVSLLNARAAPCIHSFRQLLYVPRKPDRWARNSGRQI